MSCNLFMASFLLWPLPHSGLPFPFSSLQQHAHTSTWTVFRHGYKSFLMSTCSLILLLAHYGDLLRASGWLRTCRCCWLTCHLSSMCQREKDREVPLTISTLCSRCRCQECPALCAGWSSWLSTCNWDAVVVDSAGERGSVPVARANKTAHSAP